MTVRVLVIVLVLLITLLNGSEGAYTYIVMRDLTEQEKEQLETLLDAVGTHNVIDALGQICMDKGAHIRETWQDVPLAKQWESMSRFFDTVDAKLCKKFSSTLTG